MNNNNPKSPVFIGYRTLATMLISLLLSAYVDITKPKIATHHIATLPQLLCHAAADYKDQIIGDGHCISLIKHCTGAASTADWRPGASVMHSELRSGTVIATFKNNRYPNRSGHHAAIYIRHDENGIWVWDQWLGTAVHQRLIRKRQDKASPSNTAQAYKVVEIDIYSKQ